jgi:hypothetical protein
MIDVKLDGRKCSGEENRSKKDSQIALESPK